MSAVGVSVVLPYLHNESTLPDCLAALCAQRHRPQQIVVVDDHSPVAAQSVAVGPLSVPVTFVRQQARSGQAAATNAGVRAATQPLVLLICADIIADPDLVGTHLAAHAGAHDPIGVLGSLPYDAQVQMTPLMHFLSQPNIQFCFDSIHDAQQVDPSFCCAPNFSLARRDFLAVGGFDERFVYGLQDTDLGLRLAQHGLRFVYHCAARGHHRHPTTLARWVARQKSAGHARVLWLEKYADRAMAGGLAEKTCRYRNLRPALGQMTRQAGLLSERLQRLPWRQGEAGAATTRLMSLFYTITEVALLQGALDSLPRLQAAMGQFPDVLAFMNAHLDPDQATHPSLGRQHGADASRLAEQL